MAKQPITVKIAEIVSTNRQRSELGDLDGDFNNIKELGLIQPIVLEYRPTTDDYILIAGGRRITWLGRNGYDTLYHGVTCDPKRPGFVFARELDDIQRDEAELYENIKRQKLNWREECQAIARIHRKRWVVNKSEALAWSQLHTGRLLGIKDSAKVGYALQIADELKANPDGEMAKLENYTAAVRYLNERSEAEARKEQDRRRAAVPLEPETPMLPSADPGASPPPPPTQRVTVHLSRMLFKGDFNTLSPQVLAPDMFDVAFIPDPSHDWFAEVHRVLKTDATVIWLHGNPLDVHIPEYFRYLGHPVIWSIQDLEPDSETPFVDNLFHITILFKGEPRFPNPSSSSVISSPVIAGLYNPKAVTEFLLYAVSLTGDNVLLPKGGPVGTLNEMGRRPHAFAADETFYDAYRSVLIKQFKERYNDQVDFE